MSLRNGKPASTTSFSTTTTASMATSSQSNTNTRSSAYHPRPSPYLLLIYPVIIALGSAFYYISPVATTQTADYSTTAPHTLSYFANKRNVFNVYFVKIGWFWTTLAFVLLPLTVLPQAQGGILTTTTTTTTTSGRTASDSTQVTRQSGAKILRSYLRYALITATWIFTTQWFFGPAMTDRSFTLTGGHCEAIPGAPGSTTSEELAAKLNVLPTMVSELACKAAGGSWRGGHDISGHVFMLVLSSAFLLYELNIMDSLSSHPSISPRAAAALSRELSEEEKSAVGGWESETTATVRVWVRRFVYTVIGLDLWMLLMTAVFFHTWLEKLSGLVVAASAVWAVYFLGEVVPVWARLLGLS